MPAAQKFPVIAILGPTASGKSGLALALAREFNGAIVNCDSRQIYCGMNIGTAKPTASEKQQIEHYLFDLTTPDRAFSAGDYKLAAESTLRSLASQKKLAILTGGTGFYYSAIAEGLPPGASDPEIAAELQNLLAEQGLEALQKLLLELDPEAFASIDRQNSRRVLRALEIIKVTGKPFAQNVPHRSLPEAEFLPIVVTRPRAVLHSRIEIRVKEMFDLGLETEVKNLLETYGSEAPGLNSIGYSEWFEYFSGQKSRTEVFNEIVINSRQYAKRQETWFKKRPGAAMRDLEMKETFPEIFAEVRNFCAAFALD